MAETARPFALLKIFPTDDAEFVAFACGVLERVGEAAGPEELEGCLRDAYPYARVRKQERLGMNGAPRPHWYVFRDGRVIAHREPGS